MSITSIDIEKGYRDHKQNLSSPESSKWTFLSVTRSLITFANVRALIMQFDDLSITGCQNIRILPYSIYCVIDTSIVALNDVFFKNTSSLPENVYRSILIHDLVNLGLLITATCISRLACPYFPSLPLHE